MTTDNTAHSAPTPAPVAVPEDAWHLRVLPGGPEKWMLDDESDVADVVDALVSAGAWALFEQTMDTADHSPSDEEYRKAVDEVRAALRAAVTPRPEPVVAPLPSEAVPEDEVTGEEHEEQQDRIRAIQKHIDDHLSDLDGVQNWGDGYVLVGEWPVDFLAQSIAESMDFNLVAPIVRAVPEDDEDTVRVPREAVEQLQRAYPARWGRDMTPVDHFLRAVVNDR